MRLIKGIITIHGEKRIFGTITEMIGTCKEILIIPTIVTIEKVIDETPTVRTSSFF